ncbi:PH domain-containing protein [Madurella fahalii]|uniref:PH domain-containing protein n=1 Tax=Madurella fahalii TaxID=1157608 RepID=A0ABQ0GB88_9PEZI
MEGALSVPPERGTIIGRALWKIRYVVVGGPNRETQSVPISRMQSNRSSAPREFSMVPSEGIFLSIYKSKDDPEPIQQHSITTITDCQVQMMAHRKQGPVLPTLVLNLVPDPMLDKMRKRRSSRTTGFTAPKETVPSTLFFRAADEQPSLHEWARFIQQLIQPNMPDRVPLSPVTPASPTFINPFAPRSREPSDVQNRPGSGNGGARPPFFFKAPGPIHSGRERPMTFSDSPSLRSKRSDLSSQTGSMNQSHIGFHNYTTMHPTDLPSPATTIGEYQGEFIEGWTSAQGRSSTLSSPVRGRDSVSSQAPAPLPPIPDSSSPPGPRETILDRAFQMRCIPGSEREVPGGEKLSSLARFDALMREMDERRRQRESEEAKSKYEAAATTASKPDNSGLQSAWDLDDDSDSDSDDMVEDGDSDGLAGGAEADMEDRFSSAASARRALDFITGRHESTLRSRAYGMRSQPAYNREALLALSSVGPTPLRPQTGYSKNRGRPEMSQRTHSQPHLATILASSPSSVEGNASLAASIVQSPEDGAFTLGPASPAAGRARSSTEHRRSASSVKRLSFGEFTRRLSSTSSLLLVQTNNTSGASSRASNSDIDPTQLPPQSPPQHLHHLHPRATAALSQQPQSPPPMSDRERERCGWRGSVGVFGGGESGFL